MYKVHVRTKFYNNVLPMPGVNKMQTLSASGLNIAVYNANIHEEKLTTQHGGPVLLVVLLLAPTC